MSLLGHKPLSFEQRQKNDTPVNGWVIFAVLGSLLIYAYLLTNVSDWVNLPRPQDLVEKFGIETKNIFDDDRNVDSELFISYAHFFDNDDERFIVLTIVAQAFLSCYFLPMRFEKGSLFFWALLDMGILYGLRAMVGLLFAHWLVNLILHIPKP